MGFPFLLQKKGEGMSNLRTNYKDDVFSGRRKYSEIDNGDGTKSFDDVTEYAQRGDTYGAAQINETNDVINNLDSKAYKNTDSAETSIADNDYFPFYDTSASASKKTLWSNIKSVLTNVFAIKTHSSSTTTYGPGSETLYGHVKLSDSYQSSAGAAASAIAASSKAVYDSYTANKNSITTLNGTVVNNKATETEHYNTLTNAVNGKAPTNHASGNTTYGKGTDSLYGHLKISDNYNQSLTADSGTAASGKAVHDAYTTLRTFDNAIDAAKAPNNHKSSDTTYGVGNAIEYGHLKISDGYDYDYSANLGIAASGRAVNSAYQAAINPIHSLQNQLKANNNSFYFDYKDGKYGYNTSANRGADTFHPFNSLSSAVVAYDVDGMGGDYEDSYPLTLINGNWYVIAIGGNTGNDFYVSNFNAVFSKLMNFAPYPDRWAVVRIYYGQATNSSVVVTPSSGYLPSNTMIWVLSLEG